MKLKTLYMTPTTIVDDKGKFHPAVMFYPHIHFWPNRMFDTETEALEAAMLATADALEAANSVIQEWYLEELATAELDTSIAVRSARD